MDSGHWPLYRYNPELALAGQNPLQIDSKDPTIALADFVYRENRYKILQRANPEASKKLIEQAQKNIVEKFKILKQLASVEYNAQEQSNDQVIGK